MWEDQRVSSRPRYRELISALRFVARQEIIFGLHVHVGVDDPDKAIHVANGMRVHVPILFALAANSPFWRADQTGFASTRMPIFRAFPRVGIPPHYEDWADYERRIGFMVESGVIEDYTFLWYDVRPHPNFGTVEIRAMDAQTRVEHTLALAALIQAMVKELAEHFEAGKQLGRYPYEMLDENKWLAARHGMDGELVDLPGARAWCRPRSSRAGSTTGCASTREDLGSAAELEGIEDILDHGNGAHRQRVVYEANHDYAEVMREIVEATSRRVESNVHGQRPGPVRRLQEVRLGGVPVHHRVPVLRHAAAQAGAEARARRGPEGAEGAAAAAHAGPPAAGRDPRHPGRPAALRDDRCSSWRR